MIQMTEQGVIVVGVDTGYGNIKTANTVMQTGIKKFDSEPIFKSNILIYKGVFYRIGEGHKEFVVDKAVDEDFYLLTLAAIARELSTKSITEANVYLAVGLPMTWVRTQRNSFRDYLLRQKDVFFRYNGKNYRIHLAGCSVFPQGYSALITFAGRLDGTTMLADIGNGTMNILYIINRKPIEDKCWTEKLGVNQCVIAAKNALMNQFGVNVDEQTIELALRNNAGDMGDRFMNCIRETARDYTARIFDTLRRYDYNPELMRLYIVGGGGCLVKHFGNYDKQRVIIIDDICATVKGYETLASAELKRKASQ